MPPIPWGKLAAGGGLLALALAAAALAIVPAIDRGKREGSEHRKSEDAAQRRAKTKRLAEETRLRTGSAKRPAAVAELTPPQQRSARRALVGSLERAVAEDARQRVRRGRLKGPILGVRCTIEPPSQRFIERDLSRRLGAYDCLAITRRGRGGRFLVGHPFRAEVDYRRFSFSWRRVCLPPGEGALRLAC